MAVSVSERATYREEFRLEYSPDLRETQIYNDVVSYLGEYRFEVPAYDFSLYFTKGFDGKLHLRDEEDGELMAKKGRRALADRMLRGLPSYKLDADLVGIELLDALLTTQEGETIIWSSPPDSLVGYNYGFLYHGQIYSIGDQGKKLDMTAIRIDNEPTLHQFNEILNLLTQTPINWQTPNEFIAHPQLISQKISLGEVYAKIHQIFGLSIDTAKQNQFTQIIQEIDPFIQTFISLVRNQAPQVQQEKALFALENLVLALKKRQRQDVVPRITSTNYRDDFKFDLYQLNFNVFVNQYGYEPPKVIGSCSGSGSRNSADIFGFDSIFEDIQKSFAISEIDNKNDPKNDPNLCRCGKSSEAHFHCPGNSKNCDEPIIVGKGITKCPKCGEGKKC